jgi:hypothetical protein
MIDTTAAIHYKVNRYRNEAQIERSLIGRRSSGWRVRVAAALRTIAARLAPVPEGVHASV